MHILLDGYMVNHTELLTNKSPLIAEDYNDNLALTAYNFDVDRTLAALAETIKWRHENGIDNVLNEDFSIVDPEIPLFADGASFDNDGRIGNESRWLLASPIY